MSNQTHSMCKDCWVAKNPDREPFTVVRSTLDIVDETCCFCGNPTSYGIYIRADPETTQCKGTCKH